MYLILKARRILNIVLALVLLSYSSVSLLGQTRDEMKFTTRKVMELALMLPSHVLHSSDSLFSIPQTVKSCPVLIKRDLRAFISHVGLFIPLREEAKVAGVATRLFIQRILLEVMLQHNEVQASRKLSEYGMMLSFSKISSSSPRMAIESFLMHLKQKYNFSYSSNQKNIILKWNFSNATTFLFKYPAIRELIEGTDKQEADHLFFNNLSIISQQPAAPLSRQVNLADCIRDANSPIYVLQGDTYAVRKMKSDTYYMNTQNGIESVFNPFYLQESISNLFLGAKQTQHNIVIEHRQYGNSSEFISLPLFTFVSYWCCQKEFQCYCAANTSDMQHINILLLMVNRSLQYIHMLKLNVSKESLFDMTATIKGTLYTNLPQQEITQFVGQSMNIN